MELDYFCFSVPSLDSTDNIITENDDENATWIKTKDTELMASAKEHNLCIIYDRNTKKFYKDNEEIDIQGKVLFPRSHIQYEEELLAKIAEFGGISIETWEDHDKTIYWPKHIEPVHRRVISTTYREFQDNFETYQQIFKQVFLKTVIKSNIHCKLKFYGNINIKGENYFATKPTLWGLTLDDDIFLSESFDRIEDSENEMSCKEYRVFVVDSTLLSISRSYVDYPTLVPEEVKSFAESQINRAATIKEFPKSYVLDIGQVMMNGKEVIDIIEYNPICSSGLEVCNLLVDEIIKRKNSLKRELKKQGE